MDLLKDELGSSNKSGNIVASVECEMVSHVTVEEEQEQMTIAAIKTEPNESFVPVVSVTQIS